MKVGDGNNASDAGGLIERMQEAHRQEQADSVGQAGPVSQASAVDDIGTTTGVSEASGPTEAEGAEAPGTLGSLQERLLETAARVLDGSFDNTADVRQAVVEAIVDERYAEKLGPAQTEQITRTLALTLTDDPVFRAEVDNMLLHAARELARRGD